MTRIEVSGYGRSLDVRRGDVVVRGSRYGRGGSPIRGGGHSYGWTLSCSCGWERRVNDTKRQAVSYARAHLRYDHEADQGVTS